VPCGAVNVGRQPSSSLRSAASICPRPDAGRWPAKAGFGLVAQCANGICNLSETP
jgi:hypothetical protein